MVETIETSCSGVTATSCPMAMEPIDEGLHLLTGRSRPRVSPGISAPVREPKPKSRMY